MDYERISIAIRERGDAEAIDVGFALARRHFGALVLATAAAAIPLAAACRTLLADWPGLALALFWWLQPVCERLPLLLASRLFLGESPSALGATAGRRSALLRHLAGDLTWRRLSPMRSYLAPLRQLEGASRAVLSRRLRSLSRSGRWAAAGLTAATVAFEVGAWITLVVFVLQIARNRSLEDAIQALAADPAGPAGPVGIVGYAMWVAVFGLMTPFYVCAGFTLYINRRVSVEGWDIELVFRRMARRLSQARQAAAASAGRAGAALALAVVLWASAAGAWAQPAAAAAEVEQAARVARAVEEVLADEEFGSTRQRTVWRPRWRGSSRDRTAPADVALLEALATLVAEAAPWVLGCGAAGLLGWLLYRSRGLVRSRRSVRQQPGPGPTTEPAAGPEPIPADWPAAAARTWDSDPVRAMSLLYRGVLSAIAAGGGIDLPPSLTESECLRRVREQVPGHGEGPLLERIARAWIRAAYAGDPPAPSAFEEMRSAAAGMIRSAG
jgi:hypothetical protein